MKKIIVIMMILVNGFHKSPEDIGKIVVTGTVIDVESKLPMGYVTVLEEGTKTGTVTNSKGVYRITVDSRATLVFSFIGYQTVMKKVRGKSKIDIKLFPHTERLEEIAVLQNETAADASGIDRSKVSVGYAMRSQFVNGAPVLDQFMTDVPLQLKPLGLGLKYNQSGETYKEIEENGFHVPWKDPLSTFSIDVDAASYSNVRRYISQGQLPPKDAIKIEEMINYFDYDYQGPRGKHPFAVHHEVSTAPWNSKHKLVHIGLQGQRIAMDNLPASNLVFLIDVSGSMRSPNKLPLLKSAFKLLTQQLRKQDRVAIVVYAGSAGEVLESTPGNEKQKIKDAIDNLNAGGSTAGGAGIQLAYKIAKKNFIEGGNNRVILATDGDFNVGASSDKAMEDLIEERRRGGVFLTVLGFGTGNYKDSKMEILADKGNGNHAYIDNILEAKKVLIKEFGGTLFTIAKDVKLQVEFNPATVQAYRLIGYENRKLAAEDFNNDKKDAGELGSGHSVTALYEVIPTGIDSDFRPVDDLKYQTNEPKPISSNTEDLLTVKLRYKAPDGDKSTLLEEVVAKKVTGWNRVSNDFQWSGVVAAFGMLLRDSDYIQEMDYQKALKLAKESKGPDVEGYRAEFIKLVETAELLSQDR